MNKLETLPRVHHNMEQAPTLYSLVCTGREIDPGAVKPRVWIGL